MKIIDNTKEMGRPVRAGDVIIEKYPESTESYYMIVGKDDSYFALHLSSYHVHDYIGDSPQEVIDLFFDKNCIRIVPREKLSMTLE